MPAHEAKDLVAYIARRLVNHPEKVYVTQIHGAGVEIVVLEVDKEDYGRMVGKSGQVADAIRDLLKLFTLRDGKLYELDIVHAIEDTEGEADYAQADETPAD